MQLAFDLPAPPPPSYLPDPADVRTKLRGALATARSAVTMPWPAGEARYWRTVFPQMARWLPAAEAEQLAAEFAAELRRLGLNT
jgi:uncharacterized protein (DUF2267 family)